MKFGIIFGGQSYEHEISIVSAIAVKNVLKRDLTFIFCDAQREFYLIPAAQMRANFFSSGKYKSCKRVFLSQGGFYSHGLLGIKRVEADVYINLIHGADGEDGKLAALLEFYGVSFIGPRLEASVMSFNKALTKLLAQKAGVATLEYETIKRGERAELNFPVILKPARLGSSIGVSVAHEQSELEYALDVAFEFDSEVLVEHFVVGVKEYNLAGCKAGGEFIYSVIEEPKKKEFLDYEQKYLSFSNDSKAKSAEISSKLEEELKEAFRKIYENGFEGALIRCDFFVIDDKVYLNEINPNPGSLANYLFADFEDVLDKLAHSLPQVKNIKIDYKFINSITSAKGGKI